MLKTVLAISGKPGLFKFISRGKNMLIVEAIDESKKRQPAYATDRVVALSDISIYTDDDKEVPLAVVFQNIQKAYDGKAVELHPKKASQDDVVAFFKKALPNYDADRVRVSDMRKVLSWYNILVSEGMTDFEIKEEEAETKEA
ncbi:MAG: DUF5606 domain-containing protein [Bacteroidales bacterium]|nr:DUF5606 domain-containing protein [Bacteroidales bacterium]